MARQTPEQLYSWLYHKYSHIGCPAAHMEDNCAHPARCAENGRCLDLGPSPLDRQTTQRPAPMTERREDLIDKKMIGAVIAEFEQDNPELSFHEMSSAEFADRLMKKIKVTDKTQIEDYACALWLIREGCDDPKKIAKVALEKHGSLSIGDVGGPST